MSRLFFIISLLMLTALNSEAEERRIKGPIQITSETMTADNKARTVLFEKNVIARTTDMTLYGDRMLVYYTEGKGDVKQIDASGNVKLLRSDRVITSDKAVYHADEEKVVFTGDPRAVDGENVITGSLMIYYIAEDRSYVEKSRVILKSGQGR